VPMFASTGPSGSPGLRCNGKSEPR
jgi:hypothetical protein